VLRAIALALRLMYPPARGAPHNGLDLVGAGFSRSRAPREARARQGEALMTGAVFSGTVPLRGTRPAKAGAYEIPRFFCTRDTLSHRDKRV